MASKIFDKHGNEIQCRNKSVFLRLKGSKGERCLGIVDGDTLHTRRKLSNHTMRSQGDIGFNYALIRRGKFRFVEVELSDGRILRTTRENIFDNGARRHFKGEGFELQIFLPAEKFTVNGGRTRQRAAQIIEPAETVKNLPKNLSTAVDKKK